MDDAVKILFDALVQARPRLKVVRLGDSFVVDTGEDSVQMELGATEFAGTDVCSAVVVSEDVVVTCWNTTSVADAWVLNNDVQEVLFDSGIRLAIIGRRETAETDSSGGYRGIESVYRVWAD